jgi:hypothetical protein
MNKPGGHYAKKNKPGTKKSFAALEDWFCFHCRTPAEKGVLRGRVEALL